MFQDMSKKLNSSMEPFKELMDVQTRMLERLTKQQIECAQACMNCTLNQTQELQQCKTSEELIALQKRYAKLVEGTLLKANSDNMQAFAEAREAMEKISNCAFDAFAPKK